MPHLVSNLVSTIGSLPGIKGSAVSRSRNPSRPVTRTHSRSASPHDSPSSTRPSTSSSHSTPATPHDDHNLVADLTEALKRHHLLSLPFGRAHKEHGHHHFFHRHHQDPRDSAPAAIDWTLESPPIVFYGSPDESSGALVSGQMALNVREDVLKVESFSATLNRVVTHKAPVSSNCVDCQTQTTVIKKWEFLSHRITLGNGKHQFPFSVLLAGNLPASTNTPIVSISYVLRAEAVIAAPASNDNTPNTCLTFERILDVKRSIPESLFPHSSVRIFPPTNIKLTANFQPTMYPNRDNTVTLKLDGLLTHNEKFGTVDFWRLKKLTWKIEETIKTSAPACKKHEADLAPSEYESRHPGQKRSETRVVGEKTLYKGWKSDYTGQDGSVDMEFDVSITQDFTPPHRRGRDFKSAPHGFYACDVRTDDGTVVSHSLCLELVVSKEFSQEGKTHQSHQTGTGRFLRMNFGLALTHDAGMGLSWDVEAPPVYEDVPPSPPSYQWEEDPIEYDDLEELNAVGALTAPNSRRGSRTGW